MKTGKIIENDRDIKRLLLNSRTIAVLGLSPKPARDSNMVAGYLKEQGYRIIPVRPAQKEILGEKAYASLNDIKEPVDIVNVFRNSSQIMPHAEEALRLKPKVFWMQLNIENHEASELLMAAGIDVVMNKCIMVERERLCRDKLTYREKRRMARDKGCHCCGKKTLFCWNCKCGFNICQDCMQENLWWITCNGITWQCPDCGGQNGFGNQ